MATEKEKALVQEIVSLAMEMGDGDYNVCVDYHGYVHGASVRIAKKNSSEWVYYSDVVYLSGRIKVWTADMAIAELENILHTVKTYHPAFDADGVKL